MGELRINLYLNIITLVDCYVVTSEMKGLFPINIIIEITMLITAIVYTISPCPCRMHFSKYLRLPLNGSMADATVFFTNTNWPIHWYLNFVPIALWFRYYLAGCLALSIHVRQIYFSPRLLIMSPFRSCCLRLSVRLYVLSTCWSVTDIILSLPFSPTAFSSLSISAVASVCLSFSLPQSFSHARTHMYTSIGPNTQGNSNLIHCKICNSVCAI